MQIGKKKVKDIKVKNKQVLYMYKGTTLLWCLGINSLDFEYDSTSDSYLVSGKNYEMNEGDSSTSYNSDVYDEVVAIPPKFNGKNVKLKDGAFSRYSAGSASETYKLKKMILPDSITEIPYCCFENSTIETINLRNIIHFCNLAFFNSNLSVDLIFKKKDVIIGYSSFQNTKITKISFEGKNLKISGGSAFSYCKNLSEINVINAPVHIDYFTFNGCSNLVGITGTENLFKNINVIPDRCFQNCSSLTSIEIPDNITSLDYHPFSGCKNLREIKIPFVGKYSPDNSKYESSTNIEKRFSYLFDGSSSGIPSEIELEITSSNNTWVVKKDQFSECSTKIKSIVFPLKSIFSSEIYLFENFTMLESVTLPPTNIPEGCFSGCSNLTEVNFLINTEEEFIRFTKENPEWNNPYYYATIGSNAFEGCTSLPRIEIPGYYVGTNSACYSSNEESYNLFTGCTKLRNITIPLSVICESLNYTKALAKNEISRLERILGIIPSGSDSDSMSNPNRAKIRFISYYSYFDYDNDEIKSPEIDNDFIFYYILEDTISDIHKWRPDSTITDPSYTDFIFDIPELKKIYFRIFNFTNLNTTIGVSIPNVYDIYNNPIWKVSETESFDPNNIIDNKDTGIESYYSSNVNIARSLAYYKTKKYEFIYRD